MANFYFADGKQKICRRQVRRWPSAKFMSDKWQNKILPSANCYFLNGKFVSRRQIGSGALAYTKTGDAAGMAAAGIRPFVYSPAEFAGTADLEEAAAEISALQGRAPRQLAAEVLL